MYCTGFPHAARKRTKSSFDTTSVAVLMFG
jgi:hypothetical protein